MEQFNYHKLLNLKKRFDKFDCAISKDIVAVIDKHLLLEKQKSKDKNLQRRSEYRDENFKANYNYGKIYAIRSPHIDAYYIGSTATTLSNRFTHHQSQFKNGKYQTTSKLIFASGDAYIELIEDFSCKSRKELEKREGQIQLQNKANIVNKIIAGTNVESESED